METKCGDVVVLVPGLMGSALTCHGQTCWDTRIASLARLLVHRMRDIDKLMLTEDSPTAEFLDDGVRAVSVIRDVHFIPGLWKIDGYSKIIEELQRKLNLRMGENLFEFPYDWRRDIRSSARRLRDSALNWLTRWRSSSGNHDAKLVLLGHSMGGMVSRYFLEALGGWTEARSLVTFGTPYRGSIQALRSLVNGYKFHLGPLKFGLERFSRTVTSGYQLLPAWECLDRGDGTLVRPGEVEGVPNLDSQRAAEGLKFLRELQDAVDANRKDPLWEERGYKTHPVVGTRQRTYVSGVLEGDFLRCLHTIRGKEIDGDGTVSRVSAVPLELSKAGRELFVVSPHASMQNADVVLAHVDGLLTAQEINLAEFFGPGDLEIGLSIDDLQYAGDPLRFTLYPSDDDPGPVELRVVNVEDGATVLLRTIESGTGEIRVDPLPPGTYRVHIGGEAVVPVNDIVGVVDLKEIEGEADAAS